MSPFLFWMVYVGIWNRCVVGYVRLLYLGECITSYDITEKEAWKNMFISYGVCREDHYSLAVPQLVDSDITRGVIHTPPRLRNKMQGPIMLIYYKQSLQIHLQSTFLQTSFIRSNHSLHTTSVNFCTGQDSSVPALKVRSTENYKKKIVRFESEMDIRRLFDITKRVGDEIFLCKCNFFHQRHQDEQSRLNVSTTHWENNWNWVKYSFTLWWQIQNKVFDILLWV